MGEVRGLLIFPDITPTVIDGYVASSLCSGLQGQQARIYETYSLSSDWIALDLFYVVHRLSNFSPFPLTPNELIQCPVKYPSKLQFISRGSILQWLFGLSALLRHQ
ncbi:hypothetical protein FRB91_011397 [Serendipita sp. 411]|nr:hypothetical protein FRC18_002481 [Serendipita sp. 400]KAG8847793.1 hypothetical protein FRB91_011397 [Serendipita sp. 411]